MCVQMCGASDTQPLSTSLNNLRELVALFLNFKLLLLLLLLLLIMNKLTSNLLM